MRIALLADIHSNLGALQACLGHARERGAERFAMLGDLVGYGADPGEVVDLARALASGGAIVVKGNHDEAVASDSSYLNDTALRAIEWTREVLTPAQKRFLEELPLEVREADCCFVHASAAAPAHWDYVDGPGEARRSVRAAGTPYTFCGHIHHQALFHEGASDRMVEFRPTPGTAIPVASHRRWLAIAGSVGQPRDGNPAAAYAIFDAERRTITFHRVGYDHVGAAQKIRDAGLPPALAYRMLRGI